MLVIHVHNVIYTFQCRKIQTKQFLVWFLQHLRSECVIDMNLYPIAILCPPPPEPKENSHICVVTPPGSRPIVLDPILSGSGYEDGSGIGSLTHSLSVLEVCM